MCKVIHSYDRPCKVREAFDPFANTGCAQRASPRPWYARFALPMAAFDVFAAALATAFSTAVAVAFAATLAAAFAATVSPSFATPTLSTAFAVAFAATLATAITTAVLPPPLPVTQ